jgi:flagellar motility protein MotE (MotC chaperone)
MRAVRLLPAVIVCCAALLVLKGAGLVREAQAQNVQAAAAQPKDFASDDNETSSTSEVDVLSSLAKRRSELDARGRDQDMRENVLAATEKRVDAKIAALKALQAQITALLGQRDTTQEAQVKSLVKTYSAMKPKDAARIFDGLSDEVLIPVAQEMKSDALAPVLAAMNPATAQKLTVKLASRLALPDKAAADPEPASLQPIAPQTQAAAQMPAPQTQAAAQTSAPQTAPAAQPPAPKAATPQAPPPHA